MTLRCEIMDGMKTAMKEKEALALSTLRLVNAAIKDRDIAARAEDRPNGIADDALVVGDDRGVDRDAVRGRGVDGRHVAHAHQREVERAGDRGGGEREHVDLAEAFLELLLVLHSKALLFVDDCEAEVLEADVT